MSTKTAKKSTAVNEAAISEEQAKAAMLLINGAADIEEKAAVKKGEVTKTLTGFAVALGSKLTKNEDGAEILNYTKGGEKAKAVSRGIIHRLTGFDKAPEKGTPERKVYDRVYIAVYRLPWSVKEAPELADSVKLKLSEAMFNAFLTGYQAALKANKEIQVTEAQLKAVALDTLKEAFEA
jgi:hypothetical protein